MKKITLILVSGALFLGTACTNTTTEANTTASTAETTTTTDATSTSNAGTTSTATTAGASLDLANMTDATFLMTAASSNMLEIQAGQLAVQNAENAEVKKFGQMMIDHHTQASQEMMPLASKMNVTLPTTLLPVHQEILDRITGKTGKAFDEDYMDAMEVAHDMDIAMFELKSEGAEAPEVRTLATKTLPMLRAHRQTATDLEDKVD